MSSVFSPERALSLSRPFWAGGMMTFQATFRLANFQFNSIQFFNSEHTLTIYIFTRREKKRKAINNEY